MYRERVVFVLDVSYCFFVMRDNNKGVVMGVREVMIRERRR